MSNFRVATLTPNSAAAKTAGFGARVPRAPVARTRHVACSLVNGREFDGSTVPVLWSAIGGSAAFLLGVRADVALPIAGMALAIFSVWRTTPEQLPVGRVVPG